MDTDHRSHIPRGVKLLHDPARNKGTAFTLAERQALGLRGLLPPEPVSIADQAQRVMDNVRSKPNDLERYVALIATQDRNEVLFYRILLDHLEELLPIVYTPTVGQACQTFGHIFRRPRGLYVSARDRGEIAEVIANWPHDDVRMVVVTDGERILGLGDLGTDGMGIPIGKLSLYSACAGIHPTQTMPVMLDVGTRDPVRREDPLYMGLRQPRLTGQDYFSLVDEFVEAVAVRFPRAVIQFEDFATAHAFELLETYRSRHCVFNDDIQGTASVALAGLLAAQRLTGEAPGDQPMLFVGAGEAGVGIGSLVVADLVERGWDEAQARRQCWFVDSQGLVSTDRADLSAHKQPFAQPPQGTNRLVELIERVRPHALIGVSGQAQRFTRDVVEAMARVAERPIIFALSNPTSKSECSAVQAYEWTDGRAIFASGSPFPAFEHGGRHIVPGQGNNAYVFPGIGLGLVVSDASECTNAMFLEAARTLAGLVDEADLELGRLYPGLDRIREVSHAIAVRVAGMAFDEGIARAARPDDLAAAVAGFMFKPSYEPLV